MCTYCTPIPMSDGSSAPSAACCAMTSDAAARCHRRWHLRAGEQPRDLDLAGSGWGESHSSARGADAVGCRRLVTTAPGRSTTAVPSTCAPFATRRAWSRHAPARRAASVPLLTADDLTAMREGQPCLRSGDAQAGTPMPRWPRTMSSTPSPCAPPETRPSRPFLDQFTPVLRRVERLRFSSLSGRSSLALHERPSTSPRTAMPRSPRMSATRRG